MATELKVLRKNGKVLRRGDGSVVRAASPSPACCCNEAPTEPAVPCSECATDRTPAVVRLILGGLANGSCGACGSISGSFDLPQEPGVPCNWNLDVDLPCGYNRVGAAVAGFGGFVTTYTLTVINLTNGRKIVFSKNVFDAGNNDCLTHWNNGGWFVSDSMAGDCDSSGVTYTISAF